MHMLLERSTTEQLLLISFTNQNILINIKPFYGNFLYLYKKMKQKKKEKNDKLPSHYSCYRCNLYYPKELLVQYSNPQTFRTSLAIEGTQYETQAF